MGFAVSEYPTLIRRPRDGSPSAADRDRAVAHPLAWLRWRIAVARGGPYVPGFSEYRRRPRGESPDR